MFVVSSEDMGANWSHELTINVEKDMREPYFLSINETLFFYYFEAGTNPIAFEPSRLQRRFYLGQGLYGKINNLKTDLTLDESDISE